jgi:hypothetical protein
MNNELPLSKVNEKLLAKNIKTAEKVFYLQKGKIINQ